jgi:hypothetical protein
MEKKVIQVSISELNITHRGPNDDKEDLNLIRISLVYPSEGISGIETVKTINANKPIPTNWDEDFAKSIVFKTEIRGKAKLVVEASSVDKESKAEASLKKVFGALFGAVLGVWTGGFGSAYVGAITKTAGTSIIDLADSEDDIDIIGAADAYLDSENLPSSPIDLQLNVEKAVTKKVTRRNPNRSSAVSRIRVEEVVIPVGINGNIKLKIEKIG